MPPKLLLDLDDFDLNRMQVDKEGVRRVNPQRFEMEQLDGLVAIDVDEGYSIGFRDIKADEFWVRGHIPGRPLFPGVLMIEAAAQLAAYHYKVAIEGDEDQFVGFGGVDGVKFRRSITPPARLYILARCAEMKTRRAIFDTQGIVDGRMVFEARIIGMPV
jgi:3-hydroxyacyl-[acyl-carrier-protein] dehydratase